MMDKTIKLIEKDLNKIINKLINENLKSFKHELDEKQDDFPKPKFKPITKEELPERILEAKKKLGEWVLSYINSIKPELEVSLTSIFYELFYGNSLDISIEKHNYKEEMESKMLKSQEYKKLLYLYEMYYEHDGELSLEDDISVTGMEMPIRGVEIIYDNTNINDFINWSL